MKILTHSRNWLLWLLLLFVAVGVGMSQLYHYKSTEYAVNEAKKEALNALLVHRAVHAYVTKTQRPEVYRLQTEQKLYQDYFSPKVMSFTFISRNIKDQLNQQREQHGLEPIYFKLASLNPRNPINQADVLEADLLRRMNEEGMEEYQEVIQLADQQFLYLAVPIERSSPGCMKCHGDPKDAPAELVAMYGDKAGFYEDPNAIRAMISIRAPLGNTMAAADRMANLLTLVTLLVLAGIYALILRFSLRLERQRQQIELQNLELSRLSITDALTGALNRLGSRNRLQELCSAARRFQHPLSVLMMDLDHFKEINDRFGHPMGDLVLKRFVDVLQANVRASDIIGRWGGEEFLIITPHQSLEQGIKLAEKLRQAIEQDEFESFIRLTTSIGVAECKGEDSIDTMIERADQALYRAKAEGRNRVVAG